MDMGGFWPGDNCRIIDTVTFNWLYVHIASDFPLSHNHRGFGQSLIGRWATKNLLIKGWYPKDQVKNDFFQPNAFFPQYIWLEIETFRD